MANIMTKRGRLDNIVTYEHVCDEYADLQQIPLEQATLGSTAIVLKGKGGGFEVYMTHSNGEWILISGSGGSNSTIILPGHDGEYEFLTFTLPNSYQQQPFTIPFAYDHDHYPDEFYLQRTASNFENPGIGYFYSIFHTYFSPLNTATGIPDTDIVGIISSVQITNDQQRLSTTHLLTIPQIEQFLFADKIDISKVPYANAFVPGEYVFFAKWTPQSDPIIITPRMNNIT